MKISKNTNNFIFIILILIFPKEIFTQNLSAIPAMFLERLQKWDSVFVFKNIPYDIQIDKDSVRNQLDVYFKGNDNELRPIMLYIHGGGWNSGSKEFDSQKIRSILDSGFIFVSTNYRLSPNPVDLNNLNRIKFPDHVRDVAKAFSFLMKFLPLIGGDTSKICLIGHSSGGNIALTLGLMPKFLSDYKLDGSNIQCIINLDGAGLNIPEFIKVINGSYRSWFLNAFGTTEAEHLLASPLHQFSRDRILPAILHVYQNTTHRTKFANQFADSVSFYYNYIELLEIQRFDHNEILTKFMDFSDYYSIEYNKKIFEFIRIFIKR